MKTGIDIAEVKRIKDVAAAHPKFLEKCFTQNEIKYFNTKPAARQMSVISGHFAVKEAVSKALGTGLMKQGVAFLDIEITHDELGAPKVILYNKANELFLKLGTQIEISISHSDTVATAICIIY